MFFFCFFFDIFNRVSYLEIYNEQVYDLLNERNKMILNNQNVHFEGGVSVKDKEAIIKIIDDGNEIRKTAATKMNLQSSRSHAVLQIVSEYLSNTHNTFF